MLPVTITRRAILALIAGALAQAAAAPHWDKLGFESSDTWEKIAREMLAGVPADHWMFDHSDGRPSAAAEGIEWLWEAEPRTDLQLEAKAEIRAVAQRLGLELSHEPVAVT